MTLSRDDVIREAQLMRLREEDLDELVHEVSASAAAAANNDGLESQIELLVERLGADATLRALQDLFNQME